jgi:hypothetical protein
MSSTPSNDHLISDPGLHADPGYTMVDLSELPPSLRAARQLRSETRGSVGSPPLDILAMNQSQAVEPALIAGLIAALQSAPPAEAAPLDISPSWGGPTESPSPTTPAPSYVAPSYVAPRAPFSGAPAAVPDEQVVARLPVEMDITHSDGSVYLEVVVPYAQARLLSIAATRCLIVVVGVEDELLYLAKGSAGAAQVTSTNAPMLDDVLLTAGDRIGILVRFPPALGLITGAFVDVTMNVGGAAHVTIR